MRSFVVVLTLVSVLTANAAQPTGIQLVVVELERLQSTLTADQKKDDKSYKDMDCWCMQNKRDTANKLSAAETLLEESVATIEEKTGVIATLKVEIKKLNADIEKAKSAVATATKIRNSERKSAAEETVELEESIAATAEAIKVLQSVTGSFVEEDHSAALIQLATKSKHFRDTIQRDLWDLLGEVTKDSGSGFLQKDPQPEGKMVAASYQNSSGKVFGVISQMHENFTTDLTQLKEEEANKEKIFAQLVADKKKIIALAEASVETKSAAKGAAEQALADAIADKTQASKDIVAAKKYLAHVNSTCDEAKTAYDERKGARTEEADACSKAITILTSDDARALFAKRGVLTNFIQSKASSTEFNDRRKEALALLLNVGQKTGDVRLLALAMNTSYNFSDLIQRLSKLAKEKKEQKEKEVQKFDNCRDNLNENSRQSQDTRFAQEDSQAVIDEATESIRETSRAIADLAEEIKKDSKEVEDVTAARKQENAEFEETLGDMHATQDVVHQAMDVLKPMYSLVQQEPGDNPPPKQSTYSRNDAGSSILLILQGLIDSTEQDIRMVTKDENRAQTAYEETVGQLKNQIEVARNAKLDKETAKAEAAKNKAEAEQSKSDADQRQDGLKASRKAYQAKCDFLMQNMKIRQDALDGEVEALKMAVATLKGARGLA